MKYRKKPVVIEAFQMTQARRWDNSEWPEWLNQAWNRDGEGAVKIDLDDPTGERLVVYTKEGVHRITWDDWIIRGIQGELYACKPDIFAATYEDADLETVIYVYRSPVERHLWLPDLPEPLLLGPERAVEVRWLR